MMKKYGRYIYSVLLMLIIICSVAFSFYNKWSLLFGGGIILLILLFELISFIVNDKHELEIETPDGSNQPYHPSVLFFKNGWNDWEYWMAFTPMPLGKKPYTDRWECPCVIVSHDGVNWYYPDKKEFLDDLSKEEIANQDYFSDPHLVYDEKNGCLLLYYRLSKVTEKWTDITLYRKVSYDGIHWSDREKLLYDESIVAQRPTSPAIIFDKYEQIYKIWFVTEMMVGEKHNVYYATSSDGIHIEKSVLVNFADNTIDPWHIDCQYINGMYYMTVFSLNERLSLFESYNGIDFSFHKTLLLPSKKIGSFYKVGLYRSCLLKDSAGYKAYFSAKDGRRVCIGLMAGKSIDRLNVISASKSKNYQAFWRDLFEKYFLLEIRLFHLIHK